MEVRKKGLEEIEGLIGYNQALSLSLPPTIRISYFELYNPFSLSVASYKKNKERTHRSKDTWA